MKTHRRLKTMSSMNKRLVLAEQSMDGFIKYLKAVEAEIRANEKRVEIVLKRWDSEIDILLRAAVRERLLA